MESFRKLLDKCQTDKECNFVSLRNGKFWIPEEYQKRFLDLYVEASSEFSGENYTALCWRPPKCAFKPLHLDIDLHVTGDVHISNEAFVEFAKLICSGITEVANTPGLGIILSRKVRNAISKDKDGNQFYKSGFHLYGVGILVSRKTAIAIRKKIIPEVEDFRDKHSILN